MNRLVLSSILATGLALGGAGMVYAADQYGIPAGSEQRSEDYQHGASSDNYGAEGVQYTVKSGDTLASIAEAELGSQDRWQEIASANNIENPDRIFEGQTLTIPAEDGADSQAKIEESTREQDIAAETSAKDTESGSGDMTESDKPQDSQPMNREQELKGEITEISPENDKLSLKDEQGMTHSFTKFEDVTMLEGVTVGDFVRLEIEEGTVVSLEKVDRSA